MNQRIKVLTYNVHKGFTPGNTRFVLEGIRDLLEKEHPDLVFLQEIHGLSQRHKRKLGDFPEVPHFEYLAARLWPHTAYGKNVIYKKGNHGNAILSKFPFKYWENINVSSVSFASRSILHGIIELPGKKIPLHALCVHLGLKESDRRRQLDILISRIESHIPHDEPLVIAGDFNDWRANAEQHFEEDLEVRELFVELTGHHARTFPIWLPMLPMDRIYYRGILPEDCYRLADGPWREHADHAALCGIYQF